MAKLIALVFLALVAVALAKPYGGMVGGHHSVSSSSHVMSPYGMWGFGMGYPGAVVGHSISSHSVGHHHAMPHYGYGMMGLGYPGMGFGLI